MILGRLVDVVVVGLRRSVLTIGLSPPLHWVTSSVAEGPDSRMAVTTADVTREDTASAGSGDGLLPASLLGNFLHALRRLSSPVFVCS